MDNEKEISFGAFDSELMHQEIFIPEGFEATIDGNKIILKKIESEDEKIRKALINGFNKLDKSAVWYNGIINGQILAWLEKQGEQKSADKVEPKFHKGEWIVWKNKCYKVNYNGCGYELVDQNGLSTSLEYGTIEENAHLWTIQDAKDGDVLISQYGNPLIYNGNYNSLNIGAYCGITCDDNKFKIAEEKCKWTENVDIKPSTKEQRDTLEKAMADAGYIFDFEKKELKKIEQEPAWSKEDEYRTEKLLGWINTLINYIHEDAMVSQDLRMERIQQVEQIKTWLKSLRPQKQWKPSEEQMNTLEHYMHTLICTKYKESLFGLYLDLKKLREK